ncbi:MAG TPA: hypothetical protein VGL71_08125 [Urbifossiella sp.]|jgi:hypothetical protein
MASATTMQERKQSTRVLRASEAADLIERFLNRVELYPQEWNDFVEAKRVEPPVEPYRKKCYELDPLVNRPGGPDLEAVEELKGIASALRKI